MRTASLLLVALAFSAGLAAAQGTGGKLRVQITANGEPAAGTVEVFPSAGGPAVVRGDGGTLLDVAAGTYDVKATLTEALDDPVRMRGGIDVAAGAEKTAHVDFQVGRAALVCRRGDADVAGQARIRRPGTALWLPTVRCGESFLVSGGTYEAEVTPDGASVPVVIDRLQIMAGATQRLPVEL
jgi:hypothetical protein